VRQSTVTSIGFTGMLAQRFAAIAGLYARKIKEIGNITIILTNLMLINIIVPRNLFDNDPCWFNGSWERIPNQMSG
jgi:hypothetical protein